MSKSLDTDCTWERHPSDVEKLSLVGEGVFGEVYNGVLYQTPDFKGKSKYQDDSVSVFIASLKGTKLKRIYMKIQCKSCYFILCVCTLHDLVMQSTAEMLIIVN